MPLAGSPDNAGYRWLGRRYCSQRRCNSLTGTPDERPRATRLRSTLYLRLAKYGDRPALTN
jgi:hypothetical protein